MASRDQNIQTVTDAAYAIGVPVEIALAQAQRESGFNDRAVGRDGERGLMQPLPSTWRDEMPGVSFDLAFDPATNLAFWQRHFSRLLNMFDWDYQKALIAYNGGPGHLTNHGKYGPPSIAAINYANSILNAAGWGSAAASIPEQSPTATTANNITQSGLFWPIAIGIGALVFLFLTGDD